MLTRYIRQRRSELLDAGRAVTAPHRQRDVSRLEAFPRRITITALSLLSALLFWGRAVTQLHLRHPHEDAFILFRYAQHLAKGDGIVFNIGGPHAEGATDFLWMILLALGVKASIDIALVAASLNACGAGIITWGLLRLFLGERSIRATDLAFSIFIALTTPFIAGSHASIDGFSTEVYCALVILGYQCCVSEQLRPLLLTPYLAILLGLFRPDGLLIGATQVCVAFVRKRQSRTLLRRLAFHLVWSGLIGAAYFRWRYAYFGLLLPLPLYVKSRGLTPFPGLEENITWVLEAGHVLPVIGLLLILLFTQRQRGRFKRKTLRCLAATAPAVTLFIALAVAYQSQNVDFRFQAPIFVLMQAAMVLSLSHRIASAQGLLGRSVWPVLGALAMLPAVAQGKKIWPTDYMDNTAVRLAPSLDGTTMVLTEAGRLPYWTNARVIDLVGLNDPRSAIRPPDAGYVASLKPDVIMFHTAGTLDESKLSSFIARPESGVVRVSSVALSASLSDGYRSLVDKPLTGFPSGVLHHRLAAAVLSQYLGSSDDFEVLLVRYGGAFRHVWAIRKTLAQASTIARELERAGDNAAQYESYAERKKIRLGLEVCRLFLSIGPTSQLDANSAPRSCR